MLGPVEPAEKPLGSLSGSLCREGPGRIHSAASGCVAMRMLQGPEEHGAGMSRAGRDLEACPGLLMTTGRQLGLKASSTRFYLTVEHV